MDDMQVHHGRQLGLAQIAPHLEICRVQEVPQASLGFSPFDLLYGRHPHGVLDVIWKDCEEGATTNPIPPPPSAYVASLRDKLHQVADLAQRELGTTQAGQKRSYDAKVHLRQFQPRQKVLLLLPLSAGKLLVKWKGPYEIVALYEEVDYQVRIPGSGSK